MNHTKLWIVDLDSRHWELFAHGLGFVKAISSFTELIFHVCLLGVQSSCMQTEKQNHIISFVRSWNKNMSRNVYLLNRHHLCLLYSWISCQLYSHTKLVFRTNRRGCDKSKTTVGKLLLTWIQICHVHFCVIYFWPLFKNNFPNNVRSKIYAADLDLPRQILLCQDLRSCWGASVRSGIHSLFFQEVKMLCVRSIISCLYVPAIF